MLNPDDLIDAWVSVLRRIEDLVAALGGDTSSIQGYKDSFPYASNLRQVILAQPPGSILAVFMGTDKVRMGSGGAWSFRHRFTFIVRAPESMPPPIGQSSANAGVSYGQLWSLFVNGVPRNQELPLLQVEINPGCDAMSREGPGADRRSLLISQDGETLDYFEFTAALIEKAA